MSTAPDLKEITAIVRKHIPDERYRVVLFGSRATGDATPTSDWDIGIIGPAPVEGAVVQMIRYDFEDMRTLHTVEIVDLSTTTERFRNFALKGAIEIA